MKQAKKNYYTMGIIGAQSSGKSTLLNHMFGLSFRTMDRKSGRQQTTKGIWVAKDPSSNLIVLDIEGSDSRERWEGKTQYERSSALFGLVLSNLLIVNIWMHDVGRMAGANLEIIKIIFEINLRFFNQESTKQILFIIRDFNTEQDNLQRVEKIMTEDIQKIWDEIKKPKQFEGVPANQFFELKFYTTSNFEYRPEMFAADVGKLAQRLRDPQNPDFYFKNVDTNKNVPFDGLYKFCENVWDAIKDNKELNLPSQKVIVSSFRCTEIKKENLDLSKKEVDLLKEVVEKDNVDDLKTKFDDIISQSVKRFRENTDQYDEVIVQESVNQLRRETLMQFDELSSIKKDKIETECIRKIRTSLSDFKQISDFSELLIKIRELKQSVSGEYRQRVERNSTDSEEVVDKLASRFQEKIEGMFTEAVSTKINVMLKNLHNQKFKQFDQKFNVLCSELKASLSSDFATLYESSLESFRGDLADIKKNTQEIKNAVDDQLFKSTEMELYLSMRFSVLNRFKSFGSLLLERFRRHFETSEDGMRRNWKLTEESEITTHFKEARQRVLEILDSCGLFVFPGLHQESERQIFSPEELHQIKTRLDEDMNNIVERVYSLKYVSVVLNPEQGRSVDCARVAVGDPGVLRLRQHSGDDPQSHHPVPAHHRGRRLGLPGRHGPVEQHALDDPDSADSDQIPSGEQGTASEVGGSGQASAAGEEGRVISRALWKCLKRVINWRIRLREWTSGRPRGGRAGRGPGPSRDGRTAFPPATTTSTPRSAVGSRPSASVAGTPGATPRTAP